MIPPFALLGVAAAAAYFFFKDDEEDSPQNHQQPVFTPETKGSLATVRATSTGGNVANFRSSLIPAIMLRLQSRGLVFQGGAGGTTNVFSIGPLTGDSAATAMTEARSAGQVVLASYSIADPSAPSQLVTLTTRELADLIARPGPDNAYAVLLAPDGWLLQEIEHPTNPSLPPTDPGESAGGIDADLPAEVRENVLAALNDPDVDPALLELMADSMDAGGKFKTADALRARAKQLRENNKLIDATQGGTAFRLRSGDTGSELAKYYTGIANRWRELAPTNHAIGMTIRKNKMFEFLDPWKVGTEILLPLDWEARAKAIMPPKGGFIPEDNDLFDLELPGPEGNINWGNVLENVKEAVET